MTLRILAITTALAIASPALAATDTIDPLGTFKKTTPAATTPAATTPAATTPATTPASAAPATTTTSDPAKPATKKVVKKAAKKKVAKKAVKEEPKVAEKPKGLFASLFGSSTSEDDKAKSGKDAKSVKTSKDAKDAKAAKEAKAAKDDKAAKAAAAAKAKKKEEGTEVASAAARDSFRIGLFGRSSSSVGPSNPDTIALDDAVRTKDSKKKFKVKKEYEPTVVAFAGNFKPGTIVVKTDERRLYLVEGGGYARRYAIAVGKEGLQFRGAGVVGDKQEWPRWIPTKEMIERDPGHYKKYEDGMDGSTENPLGARAIYLYQGKNDTHIRVHGTIAPESIGQAASNGCFRMINAHVIDLYGRVKMGADFVVM